MMKRIIIVVLLIVTIMTGTASATITRGGGDNHDTFWYWVESSQLVNNQRVKIAYKFIQVRTSNIWGDNSYRSFVTLFVWTPAQTMTLSKKNNVILHIGSIRYELANSDYKAKDSNGYSYKVSDIPLSTAGVLRDSRGKYDVMLAIPLENGRYIFYTPTSNEVSEWLQASDAFCNEIASE